MKKQIAITVFVFMVWNAVVYAGSTGSEDLKSSTSSTANECFEGVSRAMFSFNQAVDGIIFEPIAKGYRILPLVIRNGSSNMLGNLSSLLTIPNNVLQGDFDVAGKNSLRFIVNSTVGIIGIFDPASAIGLNK